MTEQITDNQHDQVCWSWLRLGILSGAVVSILFWVLLWSLLPFSAFCMLLSPPYILGFSVLWRGRLPGRVGQQVLLNLYPLTRQS